MNTVLGGEGTEQGCCLALLVSVLPSMQHPTMLVLGLCMNMGSGWTQDQHKWTFGLHSQNHPFLQSSDYGGTWSPWQGAHLYRLCRPKFKCSPYLQLWNISRFLFSTRDWTIAIWAKIHSTIEQCTIMTWRCSGFRFFFRSKPDGQRIVIFPWGSQRENQILLKIP